MRAFVPKGWKRPILTSVNTKLKPWRQEVAGVALEAVQAARPNPHPLLKKWAVRLDVVFYFQRPKSGKRGSHVITRPDYDKLLRGLSDALTGIVYVDDSQIAECEVKKLYGEPSRTEVKISAVEA
jgi:Holliday junction resolvase RusA-like endonuclease